MDNSSYFIWRDADKEKPDDYKLVEVEDEFCKKQSAWWAEDHWDFGIKRVRGKILSWRYEKMSNF